MKLIDLSQPLCQDAPFWLLYPPFEVKFIKGKPEHGVNAQYIQTSNHMRTHLDAPLHFVTGGKDIEKLLNNSVTIGCFPWKFRGGEATFARVVAFVD